jgi:TM2 domain-containing membrane protein YozV
MKTIKKIKKNKPKKKYTTAVILSGVFGIVGIHHFYLGRWGMGLMDFGLFIGTVVLYFSNQFLIAGGLLFIDLIHTVIVTYLLLVGQYRDGQGRLITYPGQII